jgi:hypothetical protein
VQKDIREMIENVLLVRIEVKKVSRPSSEGRTVKKSPRMKRGLESSQ